MGNGKAQQAEGEAVERVKPQSALAGYEAQKHAVAQILREVKAAVVRAKQETLERSVVDLTRKLADDRFYLTVVGQFSRGKSTLINAILGRDYLPSGVVPVTSAVTAVSYGSRERVILRVAGSNLTNEIGITELADFITERTNPGNRSRIEMAEVQVPVEILQRGFFLVDTPGLGSAVRENTATTLNFLPSANAIVFVTSCDAPLTASELGYLRQCRSTVRQLFVVVNKMDLVPAEEKGRVMDFVKAKVVEELGEAEVRVYEVSARDALAARMNSDARQLEESGLQTLEEDIVAYVTSHKHEDFLLQACDRAGEILAASDVGEREALLVRVENLRHEIEGDIAAGERRGARACAAEGIRQASDSLLRLNCAVCDRIVDAVFDFLRTYQYELYVSEEVQRQHAEAGGFCAMHTWQYANLASPQGICSAYPQVLFRFSEDLLGLAEGRALQHGTTGVSGPPLPAGENCPACQKAAVAERRTVQEIAAACESIANGGKMQGKRFCLTHLEGVLRALRSTAVGKNILLRESETFRRVAENLQRYALKHEGRRSDLITEEEWSAPKQALTLLAGHRSVQPHPGRSHA
jgi:GTP-binding protein EngB required for normal cell division